MIKTITFGLFVICFCFIRSLADNKKPLDYDDLIHWKSIKNTQLSDNGQFVVYEYGPLVGDPSVVVYNTKTSSNDTIPFAEGIKISPESDFILMKLKLPYDSLRKEKIDKVPEKKRKSDRLLIHALRSNFSLELPDIKSYAVAKEESSLAAILIKKGALDKKEEKSDSISSEQEGKEEINQENNSEGKKSDKNKKETKQKGDLLVVYDGQKNDTVSYQSVTQYAISDFGGQLAFVTEYEDSLITSTLCLYDAEKKDTISIFSDKGLIKKLTFDEQGEKLVFLFSGDTIDNKTYELYYYDFDEPVPQLLESAAIGLVKGWSVSENGRIFFSKNAQYLYMGTAPKPEPEKEDTIPKDEVPGLDLWSWTDLKLQPQQKIEASKEKKRTYLAFYDFDTQKMTQVCDSIYSSYRITPFSNSPYIILYNDTPYLRASNWTARWSADLMLFNRENGSRQKIANDQASFQISSDGKYTIWWDNRDTAWYCFSNENLSLVNLTKGMDVNFYDELDDHPLQPGSYGMAGWTVNDEYVYLYDRFDIWRFDPTGDEEPQNITKGFGRDNGVELRVIDLDREDPFVDTRKGILVKGENIENNDQSVFWFKNNLKELHSGAERFGSFVKAKDEDALLFRAENFNQYPDLQLTNLKFKGISKISNINPQQKEYLWGSVEPYRWSSFQGDELDGLLYKPENFDPNKKYPMIVYFYERSFNTQHRHYTPSPSRSIINKTFYTSNGYLVFVPDIVYRDGYPGQSAYDAIVSGVSDLKSKYSWIDEKAIALQGQSWGGYQTAYLITQTDMFAAAMAGAPVSNMTSAYGGIRWESGLNRMFQYEMTQSRIGGTLWDKTQQYIENSPVFYAPKVNTPLLMMHNDNDGAVPWYQGIEYFVALRRLNKPVWMISYNGEPHNLKSTSWANRLDLSKRMKQFFDHYLKGDDAPKWMKDGIPAIEKGLDLGY